MADSEDSNNTTTDETVLHEVESKKTDATITNAATNGVKKQSGVTMISGARWGVIVMLGVLVILAIIPHFDSRGWNNQDVATTIGILLLGLGVVLMSWISARSKGGRTDRRRGDRQSRLASDQKNSWFSLHRWVDVLIQQQLLIFLLFLFGIFMIIYYMAERRQRPLSQRYTLFIPSIILCLVIVLRFWNGREHQNHNAREIPLIIFLLNVFGILYAFSSIMSESATNITWLIFVGLVFTGLLVTMLRNVYEHSRKNTKKQPIKGELPQQSNELQQDHDGSTSRTSGDEEDD